MAVDLSVFDRIKTKQDFDRENEAFQLEKIVKQRALTGQDPAAVKLANELQAARASGDTQRMNDLIMSAKLVDRGVIMDQNGSPVAMGGYGDAVGSIEGAKSLYKQNAQNASDLSYKPVIARDVMQQEQDVKLATQPAIEQANKIANNQADAMGAADKKATSAKTMLGLTDQAREILQTNKPTGSYAGAGVAFGKRVFGVSDENTQANAALDAIAGNLTASVPRMEGPQSDADRRYYQEMAGRVNDKTLPIGDRLSALDEIDKIQTKYASRDPYADIPRLSVEDLEGDPMSASQRAIIQRQEQVGTNPHQRKELKGLSAADEAETIFNAKKAIKKGADPAAVRQRLLDNGVNPSKAGL